MRQCAQQDYPSPLGICEDCDPLCDSCVGSGPLNCTSCSNTRYTKCEHTLVENVYLYTRVVDLRLSLILLDLVGNLSSSVHWQNRRRAHLWECIILLCAHTTSHVAIYLALTWS